jgi:shikimate 5-dehydrogenase
MSQAPKMYALFGGAVNGSLYATALNAAFAAAGLKWPYVPFRAGAETLAGLFARLEPDGLAGANFVDPCEEAAVALCDEISAEAAALAAVDTVRCMPGAVEGFKLDVYAFARSLDELKVGVAGKRVLVLGGGPAGRACGLVLERAGAAVTYAVPDVTRPRPGVSSQATVTRMDDASTYLAGKKPVALVNTILAAPGADAPPLSYGAIPSNCFVYDLSCFPRTPLLEAAAARGLRHADGLSMLLYKTGRAFEIWTGTEAPFDVMRRAAAAELAKRDP